VGANCEPDRTVNDVITAAATQSALGIGCVSPHRYSPAGQPPLGSLLYNPCASERTGSTRRLSEVLAVER
jgi:hypothetical protein